MVLWHDTNKAAIGQLWSCSLISQVRCNCVLVTKVIEIFVNLHDTLLPAFRGKLLHRQNWILPSFLGIRRNFIQSRAHFVKQASDRNMKFACSVSEDMIGLAKWQYDIMKCSSHSHSAFTEIIRLSVSTECRRHREPFNPTKMKFLHILAFLPCVFVGKLNTLLNCITPKPRDII